MDAQRDAHWVDLFIAGRSEDENLRGGAACFSAGQGEHPFIPLCMCFDFQEAVEIDVHP